MTVTDTQFEAHMKDSHGITIDAVNVYGETRFQAYEQGFGLLGHIRSDRNDARRDAAEQCDHIMTEPDVWVHISEL